MNSILDLLLTPVTEQKNNILTYTQQSRIDTDIVETDKNFEVLANVPGIPKKNIEISIENGYLNIETKIEKQEEENDKNYIKKERYSSSQKRSVFLGDQIKEDEISAKVENGVIHIIIPKEEPKQTRKTIEIE